MRSERQKRPRPPLDADSLERLALFYVGRYATTKARLATYLRRKLRERGWAGDAPAPLDDLAGRLAGLGFIDDRSFAAARAASLQRRGFGVRRLTQALHAAGIAEADAADVLQEARGGAVAAGLRFAERKRIGPYADGQVDQADRRKAFAAMMRAGHSPEVARIVLAIRRGEIPDCDID